MGILSREMLSASFRRRGFPRRLLLLLALLSSLAFALQLSNHLLDYVGSKFGAQARLRLLEWERLTNSSRNKPELDKLQLVNQFFNQIPFVNDLVHWGKEDYWATPVEFLATDGGDCEDFAIAKYLTLKAMGVPDNKMRITYVKALRLNQAHMVLAYYPTPGADPLILDNLINKILPASQRTDLAPVYSFNGDGLWLNKLRGPSERIGKPSSLDQWVNLNNRLINTLR